MAVSHGAVLAAIVVLLGGLGYVLLARSLSDQVTSNVNAVAAEQVARILEAKDLSPPPDDDLPSASAVRVVVFMTDGTVVGGERVPTWLRPQHERTVTIRALGEQVRLVTIPVRDGGALMGTVVAARSLAPQDALLARFRLLLLLGGLVAVPASMFAGWLLAGRAARPVGRAYEAQANFAADASHELRTPLAFVRSGVEVLAGHDPELGREVLSEVDYLTGLTERLLTLARADDASIALTPVPVHVLALCRSSIERGERVHRVWVEIAGGDADPVALADPVAFEAVLDAIVENVARHGGGAATLTCAVQDGRVRVTLADHGPGLTPEHREAAFERFFRADPSRARELGGAGLGLALARELVQAQGGRMWLEETRGGGVTAAIDLPGALALPRSRWVGGPG